MLPWVLLACGNVPPPEPMPAPLLPVALPGAAPRVDPSRPLEGRALENVVAFAQLYNAVRFFHPSDEAARADWSAIAVDGARRVEGAASAEELAQILGDVFGPVAPTLRVSPSGLRQDVPEAITPPKDGSKPKIVAWRHEGVDLRMGEGDPVFRSERVNDPDRLPGEVYEVELSGVSCKLPLTLLADERGTLPHGDAAPAAPPPEGVSPTLAYSLKDRETRLADIVMAWGVMQHFHPYFDVVETNWPAVLRKSLSEAATALDEQAMVVAMERMLVQLHDGQASVTRMLKQSEGPPIPEAATRGFLPLDFAWVEEKLVVTSVHPSAGAEVRPGDIVVAIGNKPVDAWMAVFEPRTPAATPAWRRLVATRPLRMGPKDATASVTLKHEGGEPVTVQLKLSLGMMDRWPQEKRPASIAEVGAGISYVDLERVTAAQFEAALPTLAKASAVIFDLRGDPKLEPDTLGHLTSKRIAGPPWQIPQVVRPNREGLTYKEIRWFVEPKAPRLGGRIAFLTDERAAGRAETWLSMVDHDNLGKIVGSSTAGTNGNVNAFAVPGGLVIRWTGARVLRHDGSRFHGVGVRAHVPARRTVKGIREGRDEVLEMGIGVVSGKVK
ncbi:S41 family peptidase [Polyangium sp. 6x1]|uniref:S41 family peptidase n=1 Tax=Polyangium sp. 6x1 TaxID=3042689 RepID=UPI0024826255|nr:S41 family peptidase [Polyangium sp. 6x1]MDI1445351.1 S41 family peptidase [Polyangium sp. 6x1]